MSAPERTDTTPKAKEILFTEGDTFRFPYAFTYPDSGDPMPITGYVLTGKIERIGSDAAPGTACPGTMDFEDTRVDADGTGFVVIGGFETLTPGTYSFAMTREIPGVDPAPADVKVFASGVFKIKKRLP